MNKVRNDFEEEFNVSLQDGVLYIDALVEMDGFGYKYIFAIEKNDTIQLFVDDTPAWGDSYRELEISAQLSGYDKESYTYQINVGIKTFEGYIKASVTDIDKDAKSLTLHRSGDALMAVFPTAQAGEAITLYDATGRAVVIQAVRQGATTATIDVATLPAGVYIARLNSGATAKVVL
ncbi:MAG: T9SS type A sorting domain-containing protein [Bacteroidaceae bacterium]|nr:T9SS type A sorting domain-containing protein [Bacteroidaceae bacterium]